MRRSLSSRDGAASTTGSPSATGLVTVCIRSLPKPPPVRAPNNVWASTYGTSVTTVATACGTSSWRRPGAKPKTASRGDTPRQQARQEKHGRVSWTDPTMVSTVRATGARAVKSRSHARTVGLLARGMLHDGRARPSFLSGRRCALGVGSTSSRPPTPRSVPRLGAGLPAHRATRQSGAEALAQGIPLFACTDLLERDNLSSSHG